MSNATSTGHVPQAARQAGSLDQPVRISATADVDAHANVGEGAVIWHLAQVREYAQLGAGCYLGRGAYVGPGVIVGRNCTVENFAQLYEPALIEDGVLIGPSAILTNDAVPRSIDADGVRIAERGNHASGVTVRTGASIGARVVCVAPITIGQWAMVLAGAIVTEDVPDYALMEGIPAQRTGWVGRAGSRLEGLGDGLFRCPVSGDLYHELDGESRTVLVRG